MQTVSEPTQRALFTLSHNLLALTDYPTSLGPTLVFDSALRTASFTLPFLFFFPSFMAPQESKLFHISIRQRSGGFNISFDREHKQTVIKDEKRLCEALHDKEKGLDLQNLFFR